MYIYIHIHMLTLCLANAETHSTWHLICHRFWDSTIIYYLFVILSRIHFHILYLAYVLKFHPAKDLAFCLQTCMRQFENWLSDTILKLHFPFGALRALASLLYRARVQQDVLSKSRAHLAGTVMLNKGSRKPRIIAVRFVIASNFEHGLYELERHRVIPQ